MPRLLIVDDDSVDRELARQCLAEIADLEIEEAEHGEQALELCASGCPDLVLTDLRMPRLDGLSLVKEMRRSHPLVPVILLTAHGNEHIAVEALAAGAASYVPKAEMEEALAETVEQVLEVASEQAGQAELMGYLTLSERRFELGNDPALISPLVAFLQAELARLEFANDQVRSQLGTALYEALSNAMIHGNLEVGSELRDKGSEPYHRLLQERRRQSPYGERTVHCRFELRRGEVRYTVRDEGSGFDLSALPDPTRPENMLKARGRGLFLMNAFMDEVDFNEAGNEVRMIKRAG